MKLARTTAVGMVLVGVALGALALAAPAPAAIPDSLTRPESCEPRAPGNGSTIVVCDDGVPSSAPAPGPGGTIPNEGGAAAVTVPAAYGGDGFDGLPPRAADAPSMPGADDGGDIALDVDLTYPQRSRGRHPLLVFMHGCCGGNRKGWQSEDADFDGDGGEEWHYNSAWFAARGYVVINYTARGFVNGEGRGSTGETQLDSRRFEINDYQHLACQVAALFNSERRLLDVATRRVVTTGGSYGGGFAWLAATDPRWRCTGDTGTRVRMRLAASAPKYGWSDLAYTLVPTGLHSQSPGALPDTSGCDTGPLTVDGDPCPEPATPIGTVKRSIVSGLYATGRNQGGDHTTFPSYIDDAFACLNGPYPIDPAGLVCRQAVQEVLPSFLADRSPYYQEQFFRRIARRPAYRVPIFDAATLTDPLFPAIENRRMINRLLATAPDYPIQAYYGDYQHFTQNKAKLWADVCGADRHVCTDKDYARDFDRRPQGLRRRGVTTLLNRFVDYYARPPGSRRRRAPRSNVIAELQVCDETAGERPADEPGRRFRAPVFERLTRGSLVVSMTGEQSTSSDAEPNPHALSSDPVANQLGNASRCMVEAGAAGPGVATYESEPLERGATMIGAAGVRVEMEPSAATGLQLNARLYDVLPDGRAVLVDRGTRVVLPAEAAAGRFAYQLQGNGWRFPPGHRIRIELAQDYEPYVHLSDAAPSGLTLTGVTLRLPVRGQGAEIAGTSAGAK